jgi:hypothetical protein
MLDESTQARVSRVTHFGSLALISVSRKKNVFAIYFFVRLRICIPSSDTRIPAGYDEDTILVSIHVIYTLFADLKHPAIGC